MDTPHHPESAGNAASTRNVGIFICYRRDDASTAAWSLYKLLHGFAYRDRDELPCRLDVYFDQMAPGVPDWKAYHQPSLESSVAFLVICSPGLRATFAAEDTVDWPHQEIDWWLASRSAAPIVVDLTRKSRWIPEPILQRWPDINRLVVEADDLRADGFADSERADALRRRIVATIIESEHATVHQQLSETRERNRKLKTKNQQLTIASTIALAACVAATLGWWVANGNRQAADTQKAVAQRTVWFMNELFAGADPDGYYGNKLPVQRLLKPALAKIESETEPLAKVNILRAVAGVYTGLRDAEEALSALNRAHQLAGTIDLDDDEQFRLLHSMGETLLYTSENIEDALPYLERAHAMADRPGVESWERATAKISLGDYFAWSPEPRREEAQKLYEDALALDMANPADVAAIARDYNRLGGLAHDTHRQSDARNYFTKALEIISSLPIEANSLFAAQYQHDQAAVLYDDGALREALDLWYRSSSAFKLAYGEDSTEFGIAENNIARVLIELGETDAAATHASHSVEVESKAENEEFGGLAYALNNLALTKREAGNLKEADELLTRAVNIADTNELAIGGQSLVHRAEIAMASNQLRIAEQLLNDANERFTNLGAAQGWRYGIYESALGELKLRECKIDEASRLLARSDEILSRRWPDGNLFTQRSEARKLRLTLAGEGPLACRR